MSRQDRGKSGRLALWFSPVVIVAAGFFAILRWARPTPVVAEVLTAIAALFVMAYSGFLGKRASRRWDEVQRAGWGFGSAHAGWGYFVTMLLFLVPPVMNWLIDIVNAVVDHAGHHRLSPETANRVAVQLAFWFGITLVMLMQSIASAIATVVWWRRMGRAGEAS